MPNTVLVTGASSGIGLVTCLELAASGWDVIGSARTGDKAQRITDAAAEAGVTVRTVLMDVDDPASCAAAVEEVGPVYGLVNNAGFAQSGAVEDVSPDQVHRQFETNVFAPIRLANLVLPGMRAAGEGRIVNVSSVAGRLTIPLMGWYSASKHALESVTDALRIEVEGDGVKVALVEPGMFATDVWSATQEGGFPDPSTPRYAAAYARGQALGARSHKLPDPVWVARTIRVALSNPVPLARYVVGVDAVSGIVAESLLPTVLLDYVKSVSTGLRSGRQIPFLDRLLP
ncbi:MAG: Short-chain dehydrogenase/reductase [Frankiales bacterium]|nr:Short-chain dehydrogenase/reductase [Frankiales bacterium]